MRLKNNKGQSLLEYLILTAFMGVASMGVISILNSTVSAKFAQVINSIKGKESNNVKMEPMSKSYYKRKDLGDFMKNSTSKDNK